MLSSKWIACLSDNQNIKKELLDLRGFLDRYSHQRNDKLETNIFIWV